MCGWHQVQEVLIEVRADDASASLREAGVMKLGEKWGEPGRNDRIEYHLRATGHDLFNGPAIVGVIEGKVFLSDYLATIIRDHLTDLPVHRVRPDIVARRQIEFFRPRFLHQPRNERFDLLCRHRAGTEDERVTFLPFILLWVNVELLALHYRRTFDGLPRGAINAAEDYIDLILLH
ncbi:hypothetical protein D3C72_1318080 [compost metagenome]